MDNRDKIIIHLCADIGSDSQPYRDAGYDVRLIGKNIGVENYHPPENVYGIIANPPCTEFSLAKTTGSPRDMRKGMETVLGCFRIIREAQYDLALPYSKTTRLKFWSMENPKGLLEYFIGRPCYEYSPWEFGDNYQKKTCLWGRFNHPEKLYKIKPSLKKFDRLKTKEIHGEYYGKYTRQERRSICPPGFAKVFYEANQ